MAKRNRQIFDGTPNPSRKHVTTQAHFKNAAKRAAYERGEISASDATHGVKVFYEMPWTMLNRLRQRAVYEKRLRIRQELKSRISEAAE